MSGAPPRPLPPIRAAFTLIELLVVVAVISILASIAVPNYLEAHTRAKVARALGDMRAVEVALRSYSTDNNASPPAPYDQSITPYYQGPQELAVTGAFGLTTPLAYIVSPPISQFLPDDPPGNRVPGAGYFFFNYRFHAELNGSLSSGDQCPFCAEYNTAGIEWVLWSLGPALGNPASTFGLLYDPTNGTISRGRVATWSDGAKHPDIYDLTP